MSALGQEAVVATLSNRTACVHQQKRCLHSSPADRGLEEFFPKTDDVIEEGEQTGTHYQKKDTV